MPIKPLEASPEYCERQAADCRRRALDASLPSEQAIYSELANKWEEMGNALRSRASENAGG